MSDATDKATETASKGPAARNPHPGLAPGIGDRPDPARELDAARAAVALSLARRAADALRAIVNRAERGGCWAEVVRDIKRTALDGLDVDGEMGGEMDGGAEGGAEGGGGGADVGVEAAAAPPPGSPGLSRVLRVRRLHDAGRLPSKAHATDAAWDIAACGIGAVPAGSTSKVRTGLAVQPPPGFFLKLETRSGMAARGVTVEGGIIDPTYDGELIVVLRNTGAAPFPISAGDRIAQAWLAPIAGAEVAEVDDLGPPAVGGRGSNGFGSSGA